MKSAYLCLSFLLMTAAADHSTVIETEVIKQLTPTGTLGTCSYKPTSVEAAYFAKLGKSGNVTGSFMEPYSIHGKKGSYVSWFAVVRGISKDEKVEGRARLLLEQKYFDGLTDCHIMLVSVSGSGDFTASIETDGSKAIPLLALVRVYGRVTAEEGRRPHVVAEYIRVWPWQTFTFTDLGPSDHGNPKWRKLCKLCESGRIYKPYPTQDYYLQVLGDPADAALQPVPGKSMLP